MSFIPRRFLLRLPCCAVAVLALDGYLPVRGGIARAATTGIEIKLLDHLFVPDQIRVRAGDRLTFRNEDEDLHSVVLVGREDILEETFLDPGTTHGVVLPGDLAPGSYQLACTIHVDMRAELVVG